MPTNCQVCSGEANSEREITCDFCKDVVHSTCSGLTRNEILCLKAIDRKISFYCTNCNNLKTQVSQLGDIVEKVASLEAKVRELNNLLAQNTFNPNNPKQVSPTEDLISELQERQRREKNIVIFNVEESSKETSSEKRAEDENKVREYIQSLKVNGVNVTNINAYRLGKPSANKIRPIKVILNSSYDAIQILKNKKNNNTGIKVNSDQTPMQREYLRKLQDDLRQMEANGERNKTIKYVNNIPKIIAITHGHQNNLN